MLQLDEKNALAYLDAQGRRPEGPCAVQRLGGGVSNVVLRITGARGDLVLKQPFARLKVEAHWPATVARAGAEASCLRLLQDQLPQHAPALLFYDEANQIVAMEAVPDTHRMWKSQLLAGKVRLDTARRVGRLLGRLHGVTWQGAHLGTAFDDRRAFHQLRVDPYYLAVQRQHPVTRKAVAAVMARMERRRLALVHGDYSPKNLLVPQQGEGPPLLIDCEVAHKGDPAFDAAFVLNHLLLKLVHVAAARRQLAEAAHHLWHAYVQALARRLDRIPPDLETGTVAHLALLQLARIDGKSPAEYMQRQAEKEAVRAIGLRLLADGAETVADAVTTALDLAPAAPGDQQLSDDIATQQAGAERGET